MAHQGSIENPNYHSEFDTDVDNGPGPVEEQRDFSEPRQWEISRRSVSLLGDLGSGHFGKVMKAQLKTREGIKIVAVKMLKRRCHIVFLYFLLNSPPPHPTPNRHVILVPSVFSLPPPPPPPFFPPPGGGGGGGIVWNNRP